MEKQQRLIDADALLESFIYYRLGQYGVRREAIERVCEYIDHAPTIDAVPVVRCKDCKYFTEGMAIGMCKRIEDKPIIPIPFNHYCSFGERRCDNE